MHLITDRLPSPPALRIMAPVSGECIPLQDVPQALFQLGIFGPGVATIPSGQRLCAPASCYVHHVAADRRCLVLYFAHGLACRIELWHSAASDLPVATAMVKQGVNVRVGEQLMILNAATLSELTVVLTLAPATAKMALLPHYGRAIASEDVILTVFQS